METIRRLTALVVFALALVSVGYAKTDIPDLIVSKHIPQGCYPDAVHYIRELAKVRPDVKAEVITVDVNDARGHFTHILALLTDSDGQMYVRDEYYGVMHILVFKDKSLKNISRLAVEAFDNRTNYELRYGDRDMVRNRILEASTRADALAGITVLKEYLPDASVFMIGDVGVAVWHTSPTQVQWYSTKDGTLTLSRPAPKPGDKVITDRMIAVTFARQAGLRGVTAAVDLTATAQSSSSLAALAR